MGIFSLSGQTLPQPFSVAGEALAAVYDLSGNLLWQPEPETPSIPIVDTGFDGRHKHWKFKMVSNTANPGYSSTEEAAVAYDDSSWSTVTVPHDWSIRNDFRSGSPATYEGGFLDGGDAWYRTSFELPEPLKTRRTLLYFEGVYMESKIFLNEELLGENHMGYDPFWFDVSDALVDGANVLAIFVRNRQPSSRWYSGSGIYRPVYLLGTEAASLAADRLVVRYPDLETEKTGTVQTIVSGTLYNFGAAGSQNITVRIFQNGTVKAEKTTALTLKKGANSVSLTVGVSKPDLWDVLDPHLYEAQLTAGSTVLASAVFGYRYFKWTADSGLSLNGKACKLKGVCMHHDLGCIGAEANRSAMERQLDILLDMGCNAIRLTHNPFDAQFLELCRDRGILLVEEFFDSWTKPKKTYDFGRFFADEYEEVIDNTLRRDINNPAIIMWSIGNEINRVSGYNATTVKPIVQGLIDAVKARDTTRPVTMGEDSPSMESSKVCMELLDVCGINYQKNDLSIPHGMGKPSYGSETTSALSSRGIYARDDTGYQCSSFDDDKVNWGSYAADALKAHMDSTYSGGLFVWTGFDYIGEPTPFNKFPAKSSYFGIVDLAGFPKDIYYLYQSRWTTSPMVHIVPMDWDSWTVGATVPVWLYSNCDSVELFQDGVSLGKKTKSQIGSKYQYAYSVTYKKGTLLAKGYGPNGEDSATDIVQSSSGTPAALSLSAYKSKVDAATDDLVFVTCDILDADGVRVAKASNTVTFTCTGGTVLGTDNGNAACVENMRGNVRSAFSGKCLCVCQHDGKTGTLTVTAKADGLTSGSCTVKKVNATATQAVFQNEPVAFSMQAMPVAAAVPEEKPLYSLDSKAIFYGRPCYLLAPGFKPFAQDTDISLVFTADGLPCGAEKTLFACAEPGKKPVVELATYDANGSGKTVLRQSICGKTYLTEIDADRAYSIRYVLIYRAAAHKFAVSIQNGADRTRWSVTGTPAADSVLTLGGIPGTARNWTGTLSEFAVYGHAFSDEERDAFLEGGST